MGAIESTEAGLEFIWDSPAYDYGAREEESPSGQSKLKDADTVEEEDAGAESAGEAGGGESDDGGTWDEDQEHDERSTAGEEDNGGDTTSEGAEEEITTAAAAAEDAAATPPATSQPPGTDQTVGGGQQRSGQIGPWEATVAVDVLEATTEAQKESELPKAATDSAPPRDGIIDGSVDNHRTKYNHARDFPFAVLFVLHLLLVSSGIMYVGVLYLKSQGARRRIQHNLEHWLPQLGAAVVVGSSFAAASQTLFRLLPRFMARSTVWISALLTLAVSIMLASVSSAATLGVGVLCLLFSLYQSLYACWVSSRLMA